MAMTYTQEVEHRLGHLKGTPKESFYQKVLAGAQRADARTLAEKLRRDFAQLHKVPYIPNPAPGPVEQAAVVLHPEWSIFAPWRMLAAQEEDRAAHGQG